MWPAAARADCIDAAQLDAAPPPAIPELGIPERGAAIAITGDRRGRMLAPVTVNGQGPFPFIVDTGANRSVLSQRLASALGLSPTGVGVVHSIDGVTPTPLVAVSSISFGTLSLPTESLPLLDGAVLSGGDGLLGVDGMHGQRLRIDFEQRCIEIGPSARARRLTGGWVTLRGDLRFGHLVVIRGRISRHDINVLIDTGSDSTLANVALREQLRQIVRTDNRSLERARAYTAGTPIVLESAIIIPRLSLGEVEVNHVLAYVGNFHIFDLWGLNQQPTLLIGMDVLSRTRGLAIDYERGTVQFRLIDEVQTGSRLAGRGSLAGLRIRR